VTDKKNEEQTYKSCQVLLN